MRPYQILLCAVLGALLAACGDAYPQTVIETSDGKVVIQLKDAGAEPRQRLHYQIEEGEAATMDIAMEMAMRQKVGGRTNTMAPTKMHMSIVFAPAKRTEDGNLKLDFSLDKFDMGDLGAAPEAAAMLEKFLKLKGWMVITPHGCAVDMGVELPDGLPPGMEQMQDQISKSFKQVPMIFPEQPVGVSAEWELAMPMDVYGMTLTQTIGYELLELDGTRGKLKFTLEQTASGEMSPPGMPASAKATVDFLESKGSGTLDFDLTTLVPHAEMKMEMDMKITASVDGEDEVVEIGMEIGVNIAPAPAK